MLASVDGPWANDTISCTYDELGRQIGRQIDGASNPSTVAYDSLGRLTTTTTLLGTTTFAYEGQTGRVDFVDLPNTQRVDYDYHPALAAAGTGNGDRRLKQIRNLGVGANGSGTVISQFDYTYRLSGQITNWQQIQGGTTRNWLIANDDVGQLTGAIVKDGSGTVVTDHQYRYDAGGNRILAQRDQVPVSATFNLVNQLTGQQASELFGISGSLSEGGSVEIAGKRIPLASDHSFTATVPITSGTNTISLKAKDAAGNETLKAITVTGGSGSMVTLGYDLNGNQTLTSNSADPAEDQSYEWDACDRLVAIVRGANRTEFTYDGVNRRRIQVEKVSGGVVSSKRLLWDDLVLVEEREVSSNQVNKRYFDCGAQFVSGVSAGKYFFTKDHLGSIREMRDEAGAMRARYEYDPYGKMIKLSGDLESDFRYTGHYFHDASGLSIAPYRAYSAGLGRWLSRDPIEEQGGVNLYNYVDQSPLNRTDATGLWYALNPATWLDGSDYEGVSGRWDAYSAVTARGFEVGGYAALDGIIPFADPFVNNGFYDDCIDGVKLSRGRAAFARDMALGSRIPNIGVWAKNPIMYEIGQKTVARGLASVLERLSAVARGKWLVEKFGWARALWPTSRGAGLGVGVTFHTGPTPGGWLGVMGIFEYFDNVILGGE